MSAHADERTGARTSAASIARAYLRRDARLARAHPAAYVLDLANMLFTALMFALIAKIVRPEAVGGSYLTFAMTGLALTTLLAAGITVVANGIRDEQVQGTLEATVVAGVPTSIMALGMSAYPLLSSVVRALVYVALAGMLGARAPDANWPLAALAAALSAIAFAGVGLVASAAALLVRQSTAIAAWLTSMAGLAAGAFFPQSVLPAWVVTIANVSPFTHGLRLVRAALLDQAAWSDQAGAIVRLAAIAGVWAVAGVAALDGGLRFARRRGRLSQF